MIPGNMIPPSVILRRSALPEDKRRERERDLRTQIGRREVIEKRQRELREAIASVEVELEQCAADHISRCEPIQAKLRGIEDKQIQERVDRTAPDAKLERQRLQLVGELDAHNATLAEVVAKLNGRRDGYLRELNASVVQNSGTSSIATLESDLVREAATQGQTDELFLNAVDAYWQRRRLEFSSTMRDGFTEQAEAAKRLGNEAAAIEWSEAARKFGLDAAAAAAAAAEAEADSARVRQEIVSCGA